MNTKGHIDWLIFLPTIALMLLSIAFVYSASSHYAAYKFGSEEKLFFSHTLRIVLAIITIFIFAKIDYHIWEKYSKSLLFLAIILLGFVLIQNIAVKGAARWIHLGPVSFQPSEFAKYALIAHFATMLTRNQSVIKNLENGFMPMMFWTVIISILIALQPNFSVMVIIFLIAFAIMFVGNVNLIHLGGTFILGVISLIVYGLSADYRKDRLIAFLSFDDSAQTIGHQLNQSLIALGNGGIFGVGSGQSRQSFMFLPEAYGDFIFAVIGEEYGFIGLFVVLLMFIIIFWRGILIAKKAPDNFGYFLTIGIVLTLSIFAFVNAGVNVGVLPTTGVPMPFISYGGTAVLFNAAAIGILLNISAQAGVLPKAIPIEPAPIPEKEPFKQHLFD